MPADLERTLVLIKPDALLRGLMGRIIQRFDDALLGVVGMKLTYMTDELASAHYFDLAERRGEDVFRRTVAMMQRGPIVAVALQGADAAIVVRKIVGGTFPSQANPGTIRGDFAHDNGSSSAKSDKAIANLVHASGSAEEAQIELPVWFQPQELHDSMPLAATAFM